MGYNHHHWMMHHYHNRPQQPMPPPPYHPHPPHLYYHGHWPCSSDAGGGGGVHPELPEVDHECTNDVDDEARYLSIYYFRSREFQLHLIPVDKCMRCGMSILTICVSRDLAYAEADYIYNSVTRKLPTVPAPPTLHSQQKRQEIEALVRSREQLHAARKDSGGGLTRSSSTVVRPSSSMLRPNVCQGQPPYFNSLNRKERSKVRQRTPEKLIQPQPPSPPQTPMSNNSIKASDAI